MEKLGDKLIWWRKRTKPMLLQETVYCPDSEPLLYQEMLNHKASQATQGGHGVESDDSDFEIVGQGYCDDSNSPPSYNSEEDLEGRSSSSSPTPPLASTVAEVTVEFQPLLPSSPAVMDAGDETHTFLSLQAPSPPSAGLLADSERTPHPPSPPSLLEQPLDRTPSPQWHDTGLFHTPPSLTNSRLSASCENFKLAIDRQSGSSSPKLFLTPELDSPQRRCFDDTHLIRHTSPGPVQQSISSQLSLPSSVGRGERGEFRTPITGLPSHAWKDGEDKALLTRPVPWIAASST